MLFLVWHTKPPCYTSAIQIIAEDNGKGFNPLKISENKDGIGLQNMKARIKMLKGKMRIDSAADRGTQVFIEIPIV